MIDFTQSPEIMAALERALALAVERLDLDKRGTVHDPEHTWLSTKEAAAFLRMPLSSFFAFRAANKDRIVVSYTLSDKQPRYQLACLQRLMREGAVNLPEPELAFGEALPYSAPAAKARGASGKQRGVSLHPGGRR